LKSLGIIITIFLVTNGYFIALNPKMAVDNILALFLARLQFSGISVMQLLLITYLVSYWYSTFLIIVVILFSLILFYFYTDTLRPLIAIVPILILFLSWRNLPSYTTAFIPLIIAIYYVRKNDNVKDMLNNKGLILYSTAVLIVICIGVLVYAHSTYLSSKEFQVTQIKALVGANQAGTHVLTGLDINISSKISEVDNISFYLVSRDPNNIGLYGNQTELQAYGYHTYQLNYSVPDPTTGTEFYVFTMSKNYISSTGVNTKHQ
jgi:hypothetical protein